MADEKKKLHIAMFPWLAFGHMIPFLELAKLIAHKGHKISFINAPRNIDRLPKLPPNLSSFIDFIKVPLPHVANLPENAESTSDLSLDQVWTLKKSYDLLQQPIALLLQSLSPDWLFYDMTPHWLPAIARNLNIPHGFFSIVTAACLGFLGPPSVMMYGDDDHQKPEDHTVKPKWVPFDTTVSFRPFEARKLSLAMNGYQNNVSDYYRFGKVFDECEIVAVRSCAEFEPEWLNILEQIYRKPVIPVGELPTKVEDIEYDTDTWHWINGWLDAQQNRTVVYVAFGSEAKPSQAEINEIAYGLELSNLPFFWVLKKQLGPDGTESTQLPPGFEERVKARGIVCSSWVPQLKILAHDSVGGLLTHAGWSSVVEALQFERALVLLTFYADQGLNAKLLEEKNMGYLIPRNEEDGSFDRNAVAESLRLVIVEEEGKVYRDKIKEMKGLFGDRDRQERYVDNFLDYLGKHTRSSPCKSCCR